MMKKQMKKTTDISRNDALKKIGNYGKYTALTAIGTYLLLSPNKGVYFPYFVSNPFLSINFVAH